MLIVKPRQGNFIENYSFVFPPVTERESKTPTVPCLGYLASIHCLPIYDTLRILCLVVCSRKKQKYSPLSSPISSRPYHLTYTLRNRVLFQTNTHHLCASPNTLSPSTPNRLTRSGEMFPK